MYISIVRVLSGKLWTSCELIWKLSPRNLHHHPRSRRHYRQEKLRIHR